MKLTVPVVATIGDATLVQSGLERLNHAVDSGARFVLVVVSMGRPDIADRIPALVHASRVRFVREINPCNRSRFRSAMNEASAYAGSSMGGVAVVIANRPCHGQDDDEVTASAPQCEQCLEGYAVKSDSTSIFELAQQVALEGEIALHLHE
jgi:TPP-dependent indolepyruvate ferredoxin oxidoreductase alpha subunit